LGHISPASHEPIWDAVNNRLAGTSRRDTLVWSYYGEGRTGEDPVALRESFHSVDNILSRRPFTAYSVESITYVVDVFNPADELEIGYAGAGETVLSLLLKERERGAVRQHLSINRSFHEIVAAIHETLSAEYVCGTWSMAPVILAYWEKRLSLATRPWDRLYPLTLLRRPTELSASESRERQSKTSNDSLALLWAHPDGCEAEDHAHGEVLQTGRAFQ
jgi:hypothetical protein